MYDNISDLRPETKPYYQVLIDNRDFPYMVSKGLSHTLHIYSAQQSLLQRTYPEGITFLASNADSSLYTLPGEPDL